MLVLMCNNVTRKGINDIVTLKLKFLVQEVLTGIVNSHSSCKKVKRIIGTVSEEK